MTKHCSCYFDMCAATAFFPCTWIEATLVLHYHYRVTKGKNSSQNVTPMLELECDARHQSRAIAQQALPRSLPYLSQQQTQRSPRFKYITLSKPTVITVTQPFPFLPNYQLEQAWQPALRIGYRRRALYQRAQKVGCCSSHKVRLAHILQYTN